MYSIENGIAQKRKKHYFKITYMFMTITIWIEENQLEEFTKFYDAVNNDKQISKDEIPKIIFKTSKPRSTTYLQVNVFHDIYLVMKEMMENKDETNK